MALATPNSNTQARRILLDARQKGKQNEVAYNRGGVRYWKDSEDWSTVISTVVGVMVSGLISAYFSRQGSKEIRREASDLRQLNYQLIRFLEDAGMIENVEWIDGKPIRMVTVEGPIVMRGTSSATARPTVIRHDAQDHDDQQNDNPNP